ncbi:MAG: PKD domain-containing protein, partial [Bacteroidota bacterium]
SAFPIEHLEYFVDTDPGLGVAQSVPLPTPATSTSLDFTVDLNGLAEGFHRLYVRSRDAQGQWSMTDRRVFYVKSTENSALLKITQLQYFFRNESYVSDTTLLSLDNPQVSVDLDFTADISQLPPDQEYDLYLYAINEEGVRSLIEKRIFKACSTEPATANFGFIGFGNTFSFIDSSRFVEQYFWDFGDGQVDTVSNPVHEYAEFGTYPVRLIASSFCKSDTLQRSITNAGLSGISTNTGGNYGDVSLEVYGGGFNANANFFLAQSGVQLFPDTIIIVEDNIAHLRFDLRGQAPGIYDLHLIQSTSQDVLKEAFEIVAAPNQETKFSLEITGRTTIRAGRSEPIIFSAANQLPVDAIAIPLFILIKGDTTVQLDFDFDFIAPAINDGIDYEAIQPYWVIDSLYGEAQPAILLPLMIPYLHAGQTETLQLMLTAENDLEIEAWLGDNFYSSPLANDLVACVEGLVGLSTFILNNGNPIGACLTSLIDEGFSIFRTLHAESTGIVAGSKQVGSIVWSMAKVVAECAEAASVFFPPSLIASIARRAVISILDIKAAAFLIDVYKIRRNCVDFFFGKRDTRVNKGISVVTSFDPNEKTGPSNETSANFV